MMEVAIAVSVIRQSHSLIHSITHSLIYIGN